MTIHDAILLSPGAAGPHSSAEVVAKTLYAHKGANGAPMTPLTPGAGLKTDDEFTKKILASAAQCGQLKIVWVLKWQKHELIPKGLAIEQTKQIVALAGQVTKIV